MKQPMEKNRAFTLIELLVVISIIALLAAILFPVFARARENARRASCMSNVQQMALGMMQYTQDYDEHYPLAAYHSLSPANNDPSVKQTDPSMPGYVYGIYSNSGATMTRFVTWMDLIYPYVRSTQIFECPSYKSDNTYTTKNNPANLHLPSYGYNMAISNWYTYHQYFCDGTTCNINDIPLNMSAVNRPAEVYLIMEYQDPYSWLATPLRQGQLARGAQSTTVAPHLDGGNAVFADGHVKWQSLSVMEAIPTNQNWCNPASPNPALVYCTANWNPYVQ